MFPSRTTLSFLLLAASASAGPDRGPSVIDDPGAPHSLGHVHSIPTDIVSAARSVAARTRRVPASAAPGALTAAQQAAIDAFVADALVRYGVPGASVAVVAAGSTAYLRGFGVRALGDSRPVTPDTRFMIGSLTKGMTSLMMATLVDDGLLAWNARAVDVLPGFALSDPSTTPLIRVRDFLNHGSGVARHDAALAVEALRPLALIRSLTGIPVLSVPGTEFHYSNQMFAVGGFAAARAAGAPQTDRGLAAGYAELMQRRVFEPVGMTRTTLDFDAALRDSDHAHPHAFDPTVAKVRRFPVALERFAEPVAPAGAVWSTATDMARYAITELGGVTPDGRRVVSASNLRETQTANTPIGDGTSYGLGWGIVEPALYHGKRVVTNSGGTNGFVTHILLLPDDAVGVVVLTNDVLADGFCATVREYIVETLFGFEHTSDAPAIAALDTTKQTLIGLAAATSPPTHDDVAALLGRYGARAVVAFDPPERPSHEPRRDFELITDFGQQPLAALAGAPGLFVTTGVQVGLSAIFASSVDGRHTITINTLDPDPGEAPLTLSQQ
jgi:CubicO group peptidase (beta-lactamase class C family)